MQLFDASLVTKLLTLNSRKMSKTDVRCQNLHYFILSFFNFKLSFIFEMEIKLLTISKMCSEIINVDKFTISNVDNQFTKNLFNFIRMKYKTLKHPFDYKLYWQYSESIFMEIFDYVSYTVFLRLSVNKTIYLMLYDVEEYWEDNIEYLKKLDEADERKREEMNRSKYDVIIRRPGDVDSSRTTESTFSGTHDFGDQRSDGEIIKFALRMLPKPKCYTVDMLEDIKFVEDVMEGENVNN